MNKEPSTDRQGASPRGETARSRKPEAEAPSAQTYLCDLCGTPMLDLHCKIVCIRCGYQRDYSDP